MPKHYVESWIYTNALLISEQCGEWLLHASSHAGPPPPTTGSVAADLAAANARIASGGGGSGSLASSGAEALASDAHVNSIFHSAKAELIALARRQLDKMGIAAGFLPRELPFSASLAEGWAGRAGALPALPAGGAALKDEDGAEVRVTNPTLLEALASREAFDALYMVVVEREVAAWMTGGRTKNVLLLRGVLGALQFARAQYQESYDTFRSLPDAYGEEGWNLVEEHQLVLLLECHARLGRAYDEQWAKNAVMLLRAKALGSRSSFSFVGSLATLSSSSEWASEERLWAQVRKAAEQFAEQQPVTGYPGFIVRPLRSQTEQLDDEDASKLAVTIESHVSIPVEVDDVRLSLVGGGARRNAGGGGGEPLVFSSGPVTVNPGRSRLDLYMPSPPPGRYVVDSAQVRIANLCFQENFGRSPQMTPTPGSPLDEDRIARIVNVPEDGEALYASLSLPQHVSLDQQRCAELTIESGRNHVDVAEVSLALLDGTPLGGLPSAELVEQQDDALSLTVVEDNARIQVHGVAPQTSARILIPLMESSPDGVLRLSVVVDYVTQKRPEITRRFRRKLELRIALPLGVNVQDFFRARSLFSKFSISSGGVSTLHLRSAELQGSADGYEVSSSRMSEQGTVVTPKQPALFVFKIARKERADADAAQQEEGGSGLRLTLTYRTMPEEARGLLLSVLDEVLDKAGRSQVRSSLRKCLARALGRLVEDRLDVERYSMTGEIWAADFIERAWHITCDRWGLAESAPERAAIVAAVKETMARALQMTPGAERKLTSLPWRTLTIPVDVPEMGVVNSVSLKLDAATFPLIVGQPYSATLTIKSSFAWGSPEPPAKAQTSLAPASPMANGKLASRRSPGYAASEAEGDDFEDAQSVLGDGSAVRSPSQEDLAGSGASTPREGQAAAAAPAHDVKYHLRYEVHGSYDTWLVHGQYSGNLPYDLDGLSARSAEPEEQVYKLQLIPLRHGSLLLPTISIKPIVALEEDADGQAGLELEASVGAAVAAGSNPPPTCETYQADMAERVDVVPRRSRATYWVDLPTGAHWNATGGTRTIPA